MTTNKSILTNKKILFVSSNLNIKQTGASVCSKRNLDICLSVFGKENLYTYSLTPFSLEKCQWFTKLKRITNSTLNLLKGYTNGSNRIINNRIIDEIKRKRIDYVFIDSSLNGILTQKIKNETQAIVIVFFHNCEKYMIKGIVRTAPIQGLIRYFPVCLNEKKSCLYADKIIALNNRDKKLIKTEYKREADILLPISLSDSINDIKLITRKIEKVKKGLFVGSFFFGNLEGLNFFLEKVFPYVNMELTIVGRGMSNLKVNNDKIHIFDGVESLIPFYQETDFVIAPIISGGGMKVKITEAMMFGKIIIGTPEAFEGYNKIPFSKICNNSQEFIDSINNLSGYSYNKDTRDFFKENYETSILTNHFYNLFKS